MLTAPVIPGSQENPASALANVADAARFLNLSRSMVYQLMDGGEIPYIKIGRCRRIRWSDLQAFIAG